MNIDGKYSDKSPADNGAVVTKPKFRASAKAARHATEKLSCMRSRKTATPAPQ